MTAHNLLVGTTALAVFGLLAGCELIAGVDRSLIPGGPGAGAGGTSGVGAAGAGGTGGGAECAEASECPKGTTCKPAVCGPEGACGFKTADEGTACNEDGGKVCDGQGKCLECVKEEDCTGDELCAENKCVPPACKNGELDGKETDVDCGGGECPACANDKKCQEYSDCLSGFCREPGSGAGGGGGAGGAGGGSAGAGGGAGEPVCAACTSHDNCQVGDYCDLDANSPKCTVKLANGKGCTDYGEAQCNSGNCADEYCCDAACDGGCGKCNVDKKEGVCSPVAKDTECRAVAGNCDVAEVCDGTKVDCPADGFKAKDTECRAAAGDCDLAEVCDGNSASCPKDDLVADGQPSTGDECSPYLCDGQKVTCPTSCQDSPDCAGGTFCADGVCCDKPCSGPCQACNLQGSEGTCKAHAPGTDPEQGCGSGVCDGAGTCAAGGHLWSKRFGDESYQYGWAVAVDGAGNVFLASGFDGTVDFGGGPLVSAGNWDVFVAKLDQDGKHLWSKHFGDAESQWAYGVAVDTAGSVLVTGEFYGTVDFGGGPLASAGNDDIFVAKLEP